MGGGQGRAEERVTIPGDGGPSQPPAEKKAGVRGDGVCEERRRLVKGSREEMRG